MLPTTQAGSGDARDAAWDRGRSQRHLAGTRFLRTVEHRVHRAGESDRASWGGSARTTDVGHVPTGPTAAGLTGVVASVLPFCAPPCLAAGEAHAAVRTRGQTARATLSAAYGSSGSRQNPSPMDDTRSALLPLAAGFRVRIIEDRWLVKVPSEFF